jgi:DNA-binding MarR family transcriptional regulator
MSDMNHAEFSAAAALRAALRRFNNETSRVLREHGLTVERYELLLAIEAGSYAGRDTTIAQLADELQLATSSMTQLARRAEDARLLYRRVSNKDGRVHYLALTETGAAKLVAAASQLGPERQRLFAMLRALDETRAISLTADAGVVAAPLGVAVGDHG